MNPKVRLHVGHQQSQFWLILAHFVDYYSLFWVPGVISTINKRMVRLRIGHQHSQFLSIPIRFMHYYSPFWGPKAICIVVEPQVAQQSKFWTILARFLDYYSVFGFRSDFHD